MAFSAPLLKNFPSTLSLGNERTIIVYKQEDIDHITDASALLEHPDAFHIPYKEVQALQLKLLHHRFVQNRNRIPVLQRAADRKGIQTIARLQDVVTLLFSHATYKSYPESFLDTGQWARMNQWIATLSTRGDELRQIDVSRVSNLDDWLTRLVAVPPGRSPLANGLAIGMRIALFILIPLGIIAAIAIVLLHR